jgi:hypothetical protein
MTRDGRPRPRSEGPGDTMLAAPWAPSMTTCRPVEAGAGALAAGGRHRTRRPPAGRGRMRPTAAPIGRGPQRAHPLGRSGPRRRRTSLCPPRAKNLMPLSGIALCEAESMTPKSAPCRAVRKAIAGVGSTPASSTSTPADARPRAPRRRGTPPRPGCRVPTTATDRCPRELAPASPSARARRHRQVQGQVCGDVLVGQAAHSVGPEQAR